MRKLRYAIVVVLCCALLFASPARSADGDEEPPTLEYILEQFAAQINSQQAQIVDLQMQIIMLQTALTPAAPDETLLEQQISQARSTETYIFQVEYNNVLLLIENGKLLQLQSELLDKQISVEKVKLQLGETTQNALDVLLAQKSGVEQQIMINGESVKLKKEYIKTKADISGFLFIADYEISAAAPPLYDKTLNQLRAALIGSNTTLYMYDEQISAKFDQILSMSGADNSVISAAQTELEQITAQRELYAQQLAWAAIDKYAAYSDALTQYNAAAALRPALQERLTQLDAAFASGEISELDLLSQQFSIEQELYKVNAASITLSSAVVELELLEQGIVT